MNTAVYAFSGDPITNGHINVIERALAVFDNIIVGIGMNPKKKYLFSLEERTKMAEQALSKFAGRITVKAFEGLLVDFAYTMNAKTIIRGIRNVHDFQEEYEMFLVNQTQKGIDTFFLCAGELLSYVSSSAVKELQTHQGDIYKYVPMLVKEQLERRISDQEIWGMTGEIGAGKSYIAKFMRDIAKEKYNEYLDIIELDMIGRQLLTECTEPFAMEVRRKLNRELHLSIVDNADFINPKVIGEKIFSNTENLFIYNSITKEPIMFEVYRRLKIPGRYKLITSALLAEAGIAHICNNNIVIVHADTEVREQRMKERGYPPEEIKNREASQFSSTVKKTMIEHAISRDSYGKIIMFKNNNASKGEIEELYKKMFFNHRLKIVGR